MPYSPIPYYPPGERTLTQAEINTNLSNLARQQATALSQAIGPQLFNLLTYLEDKNLGKIRKNK